MKSCKTKLSEIATLDRFIAAAQRAETGKRSRRDVKSYNLNFLGNAMRICEIVQSGSYWPSPYHEFYVYDPKKRLVQALPFPDRVVHQWLVEEALKPYYYPRFIKDTYACITMRGTHAAVDALQNMLYHAERRWRHEILDRLGDGWFRCNRVSLPYVLKMDISKFFNSIDRDVLFGIFQRDISDPQLLELLRRIIYDPGVKSGIPIGNYTSQLFANIYLNQLDHYCKETLHLEYYVRYMDDFVIVVKDKQTAQQLFSVIESYVNDQLHLRLNPKSHIMPATKGVDFCGYVIYPRYLRLRKRSKRHLRMIVRDFVSGKDSLARFRRRVKSWLAHARYADKHDRYARRVLGKLWELVFPPKDDKGKKGKDDSGGDSKHSQS